MRRPRRSACASSSTCKRASAVVTDPVGIARRRRAAASSRRTAAAIRLRTSTPGSTSRSVTADRSSTSRASGSAASIAASRSPSAAARARNARRLTSSANSSSISHSAIESQSWASSVIATNSAFSRSRAAVRRRSLHHRAARAPLGDRHQVADRQPGLGGHLAGVQLAHVDVGVLVDDRHRPLGQAHPLLRGARRPAAEHAPQAEGEERRRVGDGRGERLRVTLGQLARVGAVGQPGHRHLRPGTSAPTRRSARRRPGRRRRRRTPARPGWRSASAAARAPR